MTGIKKGEVLIQQGDLTADKFYIVSKGLFSFHVAKQRAECETDRVGTVGEAKPGSSFGELALMYNAPRSATVRAGPEGASCWAIDRETFRNVVRSAAEGKRRNYSDLLASIPILQPLSDYERLRIADALRPESYEAGQVILSEGDRGDNFHTSRYYF